MAPPATREVDVDALPTLPAIAIEAIRLLDGEEASFASIGELLQKDQVLTGRVLHYSNSPYVGSRRRVTSISQAVSVLGFNAVRSIVLSATIFDFFSEAFRSRREGLVNFWLHSIGVAVTAEALAQRLAFPVPEEAYIAGLIHDLGKLVCFIQMPDEFEQLRQELEKRGTFSSRASQPLELEHAFLNTDHIAAGKAAAAWWGIPEPLARAMWLHHQPVTDTILPEETQLPYLVRFADVLCVTSNIGANYFQSSDSYSPETYHFALEQLMLHHHFTAQDIENLMAEVYARVKTMGSTLGFWDEQQYHQLVRTANRRLGRLNLDLEKSNRDLSQSNRLFTAVADLHCRLHTGLTPEAAAKVVAEAACQAFGARRSICLIREQTGTGFLGTSLDNGRFSSFQSPPQLAEASRRPSPSSDLEQEALNILARASDERGIAQEAGLVHTLAGSRFLAAFLLASPQSQLPSSPLLGELLVDFSDVDHGPGGSEDLMQKFTALASAVSSGLERLLLANHLLRQTEEMAAASRKIEESQRQLFHSHRLATVGRLAAGAAHEINNPLTIISLNLQIMERLLKDLGGGEDLLERLRIVTDQEERIAKIIQDLMSFARPSQPKFASSSVADIFQKVLAVIGDRVSMADIRVDNKVSPDLPPVLVDPLQIEQVFMNLLINATQAMPDGGTITLESFPVDGFLEISITDTGEGISPRHLSRIFDPFFTTKREGEGTGLGLAICHTIAEFNGGSLRVRSQPDQGSTFILALPRDEGNRLRALKKSLEQLVPAVTPAAPEKNRILVVDDERILNDMLQESLRAAGYEVKGAYDGLQALKTLREASFHLLILDIRMPRKDGLEVLEFVRRELPDLPVLIITALASKEEIKETARLGAYACLRKPFRLEKVLETVQKGLAGKK